MKIANALPIILALALTHPSVLGQKKAHEDDYLNNEIVTIRGKVTVFTLREGNDPSIGNQWGLIFQRLDCKKCFIYTQADCDGNYKIQVSRGRYRIISRYGTQIGAMTDVLAPSQSRIVNASSRLEDNVFDVSIVLPFEPIKVTLPEGAVTPCNAPNNGMHPTPNERASYQ